MKNYKYQEMNQKFGKVGEKENLSLEQLRDSAIKALKSRGIAQAELNTKECIEYLKNK